MKNRQPKAGSGNSKKRKLSWIIIAALVLTPFCALLWKHFNEPRYDGRRLSAWVQRLTYYDRDLFSGAQDPFETLSQAGADAVPLLVATLRAHDSKAKLNFLTIASRLPFVKIRYTSASDRYYAAMTVFDRRQATSRAAIPDLIRMLTEPDVDYRGLPQWAGNHLAALGDDAVDPLIYAMAIGNPGTREAAARVLGSLGSSDARESSPEVIRSYQLGYHAPAKITSTNRERILRALQQATLDSSASVRLAATNALKGFEQNIVAKPTG